MKKNRIQILKIMTTILVLILFVLLFIRVLPIFIQLTTPEGRNAFQMQEETLGYQGVLLLMALEICKIVLIFLPGEPIELVAGMCYGPLWGLVIMYVSIMISNILIIFAVKRYGIKLVRNMVPEENLKKARDMINNNPSQSELTLFVLYFLPILPKDFITYVASLLPISKIRFFVISLVARFPAVFSSILVGSKILDGDLKSIVIIYGVTYLISASIAFLYRKISKKRQS